MNLTNQRKLSNSEYKAEIKFLSFMTALCGAGCILFGYLIVSLAAGFYAALLIAERRGRRIFSYLIPLVLFSVNILTNSVYSLGGISYVLLGLIIYFGYTNGKRKSEVVCYGIIAVLALMIFSFALIALYNLNSFNFLLVDDFYIDLYKKGKTLAIEHLTSFTKIDEQGFTYKMYNSGEAVGIYNAIVLSMIPAILIFSFVQVGIAVKIFTSRIRKLDPEDKKLSSWRFSTTPVISYFYLIVSFFSILSKEGIVGLSLSFVATMLMAVYFYFGLCALFSFFASKKGTAFAVLVLGLGIILLPSFIPVIISYIGVFINNTIYKNEEKLS